MEDLLKSSNKILNLSIASNKKNLLEQPFYNNIETLSPNRVILNSDYLPIPINEFFNFKSNMSSSLDTSYETNASLSNNNYNNYNKSPNINICRSTEYLPRVNLESKRNSVPVVNSSTNLYSYYSETLASLSTMVKHIEFDKFGRTQEKFSCAEILSNCLFLN